MKRLATALAAALTLSTAMIAHAAEFSAPNPDGPKELYQYQFLIGEWDAEVTLKQPDGASFEYKARWRNHWIADGYVMMQEWTDPYSSGIELRSFNRTTKKWDGRNIYEPDPGEWYENTAEFAGGEMIVTTRKTTADGAPFLSREVYFDISPTSFSIRSEESFDGGKEWRPGRYSLVATRSK